MQSHVSVKAVLISCGFHPDGDLLAVGTDVGVWLYDVQTGNETYIPRINASQSNPFRPILDEEKPVAFTEEVGQVNALAFSQDGKTFASGDLELLLFNCGMWTLTRNMQSQTYHLRH